MKSKSRILLMQDDPRELEVAGKILGELYDLATVQNPDDAHDLIPSWRPNLILIDLQTLGGRGLGVCAALRKSPGGKYAKLLLLSETISWEDRLAGYGMGADGFLKKPTEASELLSQVRLLLRLHDIESVDRLKTRLLDFLAHPARTPLSGVSSPAQLLSEDIEVDLEDRRNIARMVIDATGKVQSLVDRVVLLCEFRLGTVQLVREQFDFAQRVRDCAKRLQHEVANDEACLNIYVPESMPWVGRPLHIGLVAESIIDNALRYRRAGSMVDISLLDAPGGARFSVTNVGENLSEEDVPHLFEPASFDVDDPARLGMSLPLVNEIVSEHGGNIEVELSNRKMTRFLVELPRLPLPNTTATVAEESEPEAVGA